VIDGTISGQISVWNNDTGKYELYTTNLYIDVPDDGLKYVRVRQEGRETGEWVLAPYPSQEDFSAIVIKIYKDIENEVNIINNRIGDEVNILDNRISNEVINVNTTINNLDRKVDDEIARLDRRIDDTNENLVLEVNRLDTRINTTNTNLSNLSEHVDIEVNRLDYRIDNIDADIINLDNRVTTEVNTLNTTITNSVLSATAILQTNITQVQSNLDTHSSNTVVHVTQANKDY
jgi:hypothetical protein